MKEIRITDGRIILRARLNDTVAARDFEKRLPLVICGYDSGIDYCCRAASGRFDPLEMQMTWQKGDISLGAGCFIMHYGGEELSQEYKHRIIIGHIYEEDLDLLMQMPERGNLSITLV